MSKVTARLRSSVDGETQYEIFDGPHSLGRLAVRNGFARWIDFQDAIVHRSVLNAVHRYEMEHYNFALQAHGADILERAKIKKPVFPAWLGRGVPKNK